MCTGQRRMFYYLRSQVSKCVLKVLRENLSETFLIQAKTINLRSWPQPGRNQCTALFKTLFKNYCNIIIIAFVEIFIFNMFVVCYCCFTFVFFGVGVCVLLQILKKCFFRTSVLIQLQQYLENVLIQKYVQYLRFMLKKKCF